MRSGRLPSHFVKMHSAHYEPRGLFYRPDRPVAIVTTKPVSVTRSTSTAIPRSASVNTSPGRHALPREHIVDRGVRHHHRSRIAVRVDLVDDHPVGR